MQSCGRDSGGHGDDRVYEPYALTDLVRACGFDLPLELVRYDASVDKELRKTAMLSPERRLSTMLRDLDREELTDRG